MSPPTPTMQAVLERLAVEDAGLPDPTTLPTIEGRDLSERMNERWNVDLPRMAEVRDTMLGGGPGRVFVPEGDEGRGAILYVHGSGWAFGSMRSHERSARALAVAAGAPVAVFDYRLAPEHPFPAGLEDCQAAWRDFAAAMPGRKLGIAGDSAGANLAAAVMLDECEGRRMPDIGLLFYGVFDADFDSPSYIENAQGWGLTRAKMMRYWDWYAGDHDRGDPRLCPLRAPDAALRKLPPLYLNAAGLDPLRSDAERLAERLHGLDRQDQFRLWGGVVHGFMQMTSVLPEARAATEEAGEAFRTTTSE